MADKRREIDWDGASVSGGTAVLPLTGKADRQWGERFESVAALLGRAGTGPWGQVTVSKDAIEIAAVQPGGEDDLRHFLMSVVAQVNSEHAPEADPQAIEREDPQAAQDAEMTERLRSFSARPHTEE
jgi:hypothetical protein